MSSDLAIQVEGLGKCYHIYDKPRDRLFQMFARGGRQYFREFWALKDVSFEVKRGEPFGIIGRNGSGKSTLLQLICGTLNPTQGSIHTSGRIAALLELGSGFNPEFSGRENVYMNAAILGLTHREIDERYDRILAFADIGSFVDQPVKTYSTGMMVRLAFAVVAHVDADILVIDEALAVGDAFFVQKCMRFLRSFMETGTVVFVSHDTGAVLNLCRKAIWLEQGGMKGQGLPKELAEKYLAALYESEQGESAIPSFAEEEKIIPSSEQPRDMRLDFINSTRFRNDIELVGFVPGAEGFGTGGAAITRVELLDQAGVPLLWVIGGEQVQLAVYCKARQPITSPIIGFLFRDRLGQALFGDNTFITYAQNPLRVQGGQQLVARFAFRMPVLPVGDYTVTVAIAEGSQQEHVQHHWRHDALVLKSHSSSVATGLVGIPMQTIRMDIYE